MSIQVYLGMKIARGEKMETTLEPTTYEKTLIRIVRKLPIERTAQILDFARYIQKQTQEDFGILEDDFSPEEILADEKRWDAQFAESQTALSKMADKVRADIKAGHTKKMVFTKDGNIAPE